MVGMQSPGALLLTDARVWVLVVMLGRAKRWDGCCTCV